MKRKEIYKGTIVKILFGPYSGMIGEVVGIGRTSFYQVRVRPGYDVQARASELSALTVVEKLARVLDEGD